MSKKNKRLIKVGNHIIGNGTITIQSMLKKRINNTKQALKKINYLKSLGCDIIRIAVPDENSIKYLKEITRYSPIPVVADIHFDYKLAIASIKSGVDKIRINPGNIGDKNKVKNIIDCLKEYNIPVRIGINSGSLPKAFLKKYDDNIKVMIETAKSETGIFEKYGYENIVLSFKSSDIINNIKINRLADKTFDFPLHIGITEAGTLMDGAIKNSIGISNLLLDGIGDTIRVSLTSSEADEIIVAKKILSSIGLKNSINIISCPTCGRTEVSIEKIVSKIRKKVENKKFNRNLTIAVMGCVVNGPGEAKSADFGVACGKRKSVIFYEGKKNKIIKNNKIIDELLILAQTYEK